MAMAIPKSPWQNICQYFWIIVTVLIIVSIVLAGFYGLFLAYGVMMGI